MKWNWRERWQKVFEELKKRFMIEPVLVITDLNKEMRENVGVLDFAIGGVLLIKCEDEKWRPVAYISKLVNKAKKTIKFIIKGC